MSRKNHNAFLKDQVKSEKGKIPKLSHHLCVDDFIVLLLDCSHLE